MRRLTVLLVGVVAAGSFLAFRPMTTEVTAVEGVWTVIHVTWEGETFDRTQVPSILILTAGHYASVTVRGTEPRETLPEEPTDEQRLAAWSPFFASAGTYEVSGSKLTLHVMLARVPSGVGSSPELEYRIEGDQLITTATSNAGVTTRTTYIRLD